MKKRLLLFTVALSVGILVMGQELIQNGDFSLPDDGMKYSRIDSIPGWLTDDMEDNSGRDFVEGNAVGWHWDGTGSIYQVIGTVPAIGTRYDFSFQATCFYSYWSGDYVTELYAILSTFSGDDPATRVPFDSVTFTQSCIGADWLTWATKTGEFMLQAGNAHAGENLVFEIDIFDSRIFGYDESYSYLYYDNVSVTSQATSVIEAKPNDIRVVSTPGMIRVEGDRKITSAMLFDMTGRRVLEVHPQSSGVTLDVGNLNHGIHILSLELNGEIYTRKVVL